MTLNSLNKRYLKPIRTMIVIGVGLLLAIVSVPHWSAQATNFDRPPTGNGNSILSSLFVDEQKLTASDGTASVFFGNSVAVSGATLVVGAPFDSVNSFDQGAAYVFTRQGGSWVETQKLTASDGAEPDLFGFSVAISGSTIVVGAQGDNIGNNLTQGSAYVFSRQGGSWVETQKLISSDGATGDQFGNAVAISGSTIVVNALIDTVNGNFAQGSAYVFNRQGGSWVETQKLTASDGAAGDQFGNSIAVSGSTIVVGAPLHDVAGASDQGSAYVFDRQGRSWVETQELTGNDGAADNQFGWSVAVGGATIVVGAVNNHFGNTFSRGSAYVFDRRGGSWAELQKLTASDEAINNFFAWSIAITGSTIVATAIFNVPGITNRGAAYVFNRQGASWVETQKLTASDGVANDRFGWSVAASGPTIVVGAPNDDVGNNINQGSAYVFGP